MALSMAYDYFCSDTLPGMLFFAYRIILIVNLIEIFQLKNRHLFQILGVFKDGNSVEIGFQMDKDSILFLTVLNIQLHRKQLKAF